jgi:hypothetical protein
MKASLNFKVQLQYISNILVVVGKIKFSVTAKESIILSNNDYNNFYNTLIDDNMEMAKRIASVSQPDAKYVADAMVKAFDKKGINIILYYINIILYYNNEICCGRNGESI